MNTFDYFSGKRVLVTGASGFIGSNLCKVLVKNEAEVHGIHLEAPESILNIKIHWWKCNLKYIDATRKLIKNLKPDIIIHLAGWVKGSRDLEHVMPTFHSILTSNLNVLTAATEVGCQRVIIAGSLEEPDNYEPHMIPSSPYAAAKWGASAYARMFHKLYNTPVVIARVFMVYGAGQRDLKKLIPYTILSHFQNSIPIFTSGSRQIDWIYVDDVVDGLLTAASTPNIEGHTIDIGSGETVSIKDIVNQLTTILKSKIKPEFGKIPDRPLEQIRIANISKTHSAIGWKPKTTLDVGLKKTVEWYKQNRIISFYLLMQCEQIYSIL